MRIEIIHATGLDNTKLEFSTNAYGKPFLVNNQNIHFNISHSSHYVTSVVSDEPVGIDVELNKKADIKIAKRFFAKDEALYIMQGQRERRFCEVWTKKESRIKWEGKGLHKPLPSFSVFDNDDQNPPFYHEIFNNDEAICHTCSTKREPPEIKFIDASTFIEYAIQVLK